MDIIQVFQQWSLKLIQNAEQLQECNHPTTHLQLFSRLLLSLDPQFFVVKQTPTLSLLQQQVCEYFVRFLNLSRKPSLQSNSQLNDPELLHMFGLIFELALRIDQPAAIGHIVQLDRESQEALLPFVKAVVDEKNTGAGGSPRNLKFKTEESDVSQMSFISELERREIEIRELTERLEGLERELKDSKQKNQALLADNERMAEELQHTRSEREHLFSEFGLPYGSTLIEAAHHIKRLKDASDSQLESLQKYNEQLRSDLQNRSIELQMMSYSLVQFKKESQITRDSEIEDDLKLEVEKLRYEISTKTFAIAQTTAEMAKIKEELAKTRRRNIKLEGIYDKYKEFKKLHSNFTVHMNREFQMIR